MWVYSFLGMIAFSCLFVPAQDLSAAEISQATKDCLECHDLATPAIVADWKKSRHYQVSPAEAVKKPKNERRVSVKKPPENLAGFAVGCAECHANNPGKHPDSYDHEDIKVHTVVTPQDCQVCHPDEAEQFARNKMAWARTNLTENSLYKDMISRINGDWSLKDGALTSTQPDEITNADSCFSCHGTKVEMKGLEKRDTDFGELDLPLFSGWPNNGVGRINPDGSRGSCAACHTRHQFSIKTARQPYTCSQCHKGPDVPAYKVYEVSKHGNIFASLKDEWDFNAVPWKVGRDLTAPTCAACHISLLVDQEDGVVAGRTHRINDRLPWRLFGLIYAHPQPATPDTHKIINKGGWPLPTELTGEPVSAFLIDEKVRQERTRTFQGICQACHSLTWVRGHWEKLELAIKTTNADTLTATQLMKSAWDQGLAQGPDKGGSPFDEAMERQWAAQWLFDANSVRLASAMGGTDYGVFDQGRWESTRNLQILADWLKFLKAARPTDLNKKGEK